MYRVNDIIKWSIDGPDIEYYITEINGNRITLTWERTYGKGIRNHSYSIDFMDKMIRKGDCYIYKKVELLPEELFTL
jgi:hypothetical protein